MGAALGPAEAGRRFIAGHDPARVRRVGDVGKAAVNHMTRLLASQLGPGIRVNAVAPGLIDTPWYEDAEQVWESSRDWITENTPLRRVGTPEDVAEATLYLANAAYTTGDVLTVDGGRHIV